MLQWVMCEVVQFAFTRFVHGSWQRGGAHPVVTTNGAQVHDFSKQHAVPLCEHTLVPKRCRVVVSMWQSWSLDITRLFESGNMRKRCSEGNEPNWRAYSCWFNV